MGRFVEQQKTKEETKEKDKTRREKLAGYFLIFLNCVLQGLLSVSSSPCILTCRTRIIGTPFVRGLY